MSKITKVTFTCDYCHKESDNEEFATNYVQLLTKADGYCEVEKLKVMSFNGDLCDPCHSHILEFLKKRIDKEAEAIDVFKQFQGDVE